jgi:hypothetical protein
VAKARPCSTGLTAAASPGGGRWPSPQAQEQLFNALAKVADRAFEGDDPELIHLTHLQRTLGLPDLNTTLLEK